MGMSSDIEFQYKFKYKAKLSGGLTEHELDYVFTGITDNIPSLNPMEAMDWKYISLQELNDDIEKNPKNYTVWFREILKSFSEQKILV